MELQEHSEADLYGQTHMNTFLTDSSSIGSSDLSDSVRDPATERVSGLQTLPVHSGNLSKFPLATLPTSPGTASSGPLKFNVFSSFMGRRKRKIPHTNEVKQALHKLDKLSTKTLKQQQVLLDLFKDWGAGLSDSASRELIINLFNLLIGTLKYRPRVCSLINVYRSS